MADVEVEGDVRFERLTVGTNPVQLRALAEWLVEREVEEVVMESTAQSWRPVWEALEPYWRPKRRTRPDANPVSGTLHLAQAHSNRGAGGRKRDFPDAERLVKRLVAQELTLSFVPDAEQRLWRTVMRRKYQVTRRVQLHNRLEALLEEAHIKISSVVSDLSPSSINRWRSCSLTTTMPCNAWLKCPAWASIPRSRSSRKSVPVPRRFRQRNSSRPGWARAQAMKRVPASTTVIAVPKAIDRCDAS